MHFVKVHLECELFSVCVYFTPCRDSIIPVEGGTSCEPDYNNINVSPAALASSDEERDHQATIAGQEEALYTNPEDVISALDLEVKGDKRQVSGM